jgi:uncharacterized SAM-binding protein YcdF (DUF218 family)
MSCAKRCLLFVLALFILVSFTAAAALYSAARWLHHADAPQKSDAIVLLAGDLTRTFEAAQLYREGYAPRVYISVAVHDSSSRLFEDAGIAITNAEDLARQVLLRKGVPDSAIAWLAKDMLSTATEAQATKTLVDRGERRLLVVTSPYHTRRTGIIFHRAIPDADIRIIASRYETFPEDWWREQRASVSVILEVAKLTFYFLGGRF